jgi:DNA-binding MarR family transcriptional regulator
MDGALDVEDADTYYLDVSDASPGEQSLPRLPCACANIRRAARATTQLYDRALREAGLNTAQFTLLQTLATAGRVTQGRVGRVLALDSTTLSRTLRPLEAKRWIRCEPGKDRRERQLELTAAGRAQLDRATPAWERAQRRLRDRIGSGRWEALLSELSALAGAARGA